MEIILRLFKGKFQPLKCHISFPHTHIERSKRTFTREYFTVMTCMIAVNQLCVLSLAVWWVSITSLGTPPPSEQYLKCLEKWLKKNVRTGTYNRVKRVTVSTALMLIWLLDSSNNYFGQKREISIFLSSIETVF